MASTQRPESNAEARRRLTEAMLVLGRRIELQPPGPERLELLRQQARLSDEREVFRAIRR